MPRTARSISCVTDIRDKNEFEGEIVKTHKYWAVGALACIFRSKVQLRKSEEVEKKIRIFMQFGNICYGIWFCLNTIINT